MNDVKYFAGDSLDVLKHLPENTADAIIVDPPSAVKFLGMVWDADRGGRDKWVEWLSGLLSEALRVTKPGGHIVALMKYLCQLVASPNGHPLTIDPCCGS